MEDDINIRLDFGDIILARRCEDDLEEHHEISPHIVIGSEEDYIVVLQGTSQEKTGKYEYAHYKIEEGRHGLTQDTYFKTREWKRIHKDKVLRKISKLSKTEKTYIKKKVAFSNLATTHSTDWVNISMPPMQVGDIIRPFGVIDKDEYYLIIENDEKTYKCIHLKRSFDDESININGTHYVIDYNDVVEINNIKDYIRPDTLKIDQVKIVLNKFRRIQSSLPEPKVGRGSLVGINGELYYVYNIEKNNLLAYKVSLDKDDAHAQIKINDIVYYTQFKESSFDKNNIVVPLENATKIEVEENKKIKKVYSREIKQKQERYKHLINKSVQTGTCASIITDIDKKYIVIYRLGNEVCVINYDDYLNGRKEVNIFSVSLFTEAHRMQANEFSNVLEFVKDKVLKQFHSHIFLKVYESYTSITDIKEKNNQKIIEYNE